MAATGTSPCAAIPAAIPMSVLLGDADIEKKRSGNFSAKRVRPVPDGIAAVIAQMRLSFSASAQSSLPKNAEKSSFFAASGAPCYAVELGNAVVFLRILLTRGITSALLCHNMQQNRFFIFFASARNSHTLLRSFRPPDQDR